MAGIEDLMRLVPPPPAPIDAEGDWARIEAELGLRLPPDYKGLVRHYGFGCFDDITVWTPFTTRHGGASNLVTNAKRLLDANREFRDNYPEEFPYPLYPEPGGLLEWASTGNGDQLCWVTAGKPDGWPVVLWNVRKGIYIHDMGAVDLLYSYLSGQREYELLAPAPAQPWFDTHRERCHVYVSLSEGGELQYEQRLRILREALAPTADRGAVSNERGDRQDHFKVVDRDWLLMYETAYGHMIRVAFPPEDNDDARTAILEAAEAMGCRVVGVKTIYGESDWSQDGSGQH